MPWARVLLCPSETGVADKGLQSDPCEPLVASRYAPLTWLP